MEDITFSRNLTASKLETSQASRIGPSRRPLLRCTCRESPCRTAAAVLISSRRGMRRVRVEASGTCPSRSVEAPCDSVRARLAAEPRCCTAAEPADLRRFQRRSRAESAVPTLPTPPGLRRPDWLSAELLFLHPTDRCDCATRQAPDLAASPSAIRQEESVCI